MDNNTFTLLTSTTSTNSHAMDMIRSGKAVNGEAWFTLHQTAGKGRRAKHWESEKGANITMSIAVTTDFLPVYRQFYLSMAVALACHSFFRKYAGSGTKIKWPNDLYFNDKKAGGILIENLLKGDVWQWAVIGIGININQTNFNNLFNPTSIKAITGKDYDVLALAKELHTLLISRIDQLRTDSSALLSYYNSVLYKRNEKIRLLKGNIGFETIIEGVNEKGQLLTNDSIQRVFDFDEVEWAIPG